jgi:LysM repeat protein
MKINDVVTEGPMDAFKQMGAGISGAVKNLGAPVAGARQAVARSSGQAEINSQVKGMMPYWQKQVQALQTGGVDMTNIATYQQQFQDWMTKSGFPGSKDFSVLGALSSTRPGDVQNYLAKAVAMNMSGQAQAKTPAAGAGAAKPAIMAPVGGTTPAPAAAPAAQSKTPAAGAGAAKPAIMAPVGGTTTPAPAAAPVADTGLFADPAAFKSAWDNWLNGPGSLNAAGGKFDLSVNRELLGLFQHMYSQAGGVMKESRFIAKRNMLIEDIVRREPIYESSYNASRMLVEAALTQDQIQQIFAAVADGAKAGGNVANTGDAPASNKTMLGKGTAAISGAWNKVKTAISQSGPVSGFDVFVDKIQRSLLQSSGGQSGAVSKAIQKYREFATAHPVMQGAIYAGLIALAGISGAGLGGAAIIGGIKIFDRMLQGDKASSAIWKGFKTGAVAYGAGQLGQAMQGGPAPDPTDMGGASEFGGAPVQPWGGQGIQASPDQFMPGGVNLPDTNVQMPDLSNVPLPGSEYVVRAGDNLSTLAQNNNMSVQDLMKANPQITNPNDLSVGQKLTIPAPATGNPIYAQGVGTAADTASKVATGQYTPSRFGIREHFHNPYIDWSRTGLNEGTGTMMIFITGAGVQKVFKTVVSEGVWDSIKGVAKSSWEGATNKITVNKLDMNWRRSAKLGNEASVDGEQVKKFLRDQGVTDVLINKVFQDLKLDAATPANAAAGAAPAPAATTGSPFNNPNKMQQEFDQFMKAGGKLPRETYGLIAQLLRDAGKQLMEHITYLKFRRALRESMK